MNQDDIQLIFLQECDEGLASAEIALIDCQSNPEDSEAINSIFRAVHSIKGGAGAFGFTALQRSEEHTSELQSLMRISYAVFCLKQKKTKPHINIQRTSQEAA